MYVALAILPGLFRSRGEQHLLRVIMVLDLAMPIVHGIGLGDGPGLVEALNDILGQGPLLESIQVGRELFHARHADDDAVVAVLDPELAVVHRPPQGRLEHGQAGLVGGVLDNLQGPEGRVTKVAAAVHLAAGGGVAEAALGRGGGHVGGPDLAAQQTAGNGVVDDDVQAVTAAGRDQLALDGPREGVVHALVHARAHPAVVLGRQADLGHLEGCEVGDAQPHELSLLM